MEWVGVVSGIVGAVVAVVALVRTIRTDRRIEAMEKKWEVTHFQRQAYLLTNRQARTAYDVEIDSEQLLDKPPTGAMKPNEEHKFFIRDRMSGGSEALTISWARRPGGKRESIVVWAPPRTE